MSYYWISKKKDFGRDVKYGDEVKGLSESRAKELIGKGVVSKSKPESITSAEKNKIVEVAEVNESLREEIAALKEDSEKNATVKMREAKQTIKRRIMSTDKKEGFRELKPGKTVQLGGRKFQGNKVRIIKDNKGKEKKVITESSTRNVPEKLIDQHKLNDRHFVSAQKTYSYPKSKK